MSTYNVLVLRPEPGRVQRLPATALAAVLGIALSFSAAAQPSAPRGLAAAPGDAEATLSWFPTHEAIIGYSVRYAASEAALAGNSVAWTPISESGTATISHTVPSLTNGARYYFQIRAASANGDGPPSNVATTRLATSPTAVVAINDGGLRNALEQSLGVASGAAITQLDLATLESLFAASVGISDLTGLEHAINLTRLGLLDNAISDVSALGSLQSLTSLDLAGNAISDISALGSLESLTSLRLFHNTISDVSALGSLESLTSLKLSNNAISDVSVLGSLESLTSLDLAHNTISDVSALGSLESLTRLDLSYNTISDVSALGALKSLTDLRLLYNTISDVSELRSLESLTFLDLSHNTISDVSALRSLASLTGLSLGDNAISDVSALGSLKSLTWLSLDDNAISDVSALGSLKSLTSLGLSNNAISDVSALGSLECLTWLGLSNNAISDASALGSLESLTELRLYNNKISDVAALGSLESLRSLDLSYNTISDASVLVSALGSLEYLSSLSLSGNAISDVSELGSLETLRSLDLSYNAISDVSVLGSLESLDRLDLSYNAISDVSALGSLESLTRLDLRDNAISDVSKLGSLKLLRELYLASNAISDVSALEPLESLRSLNLSYNAISDISALGSLIFLRELYLASNAISDVSALEPLEFLRSLDLHDNAISDVSALGSLESLTRLDLFDNTISDVSALGSLESLDRLDLRNNAISDVSALGALESLTWLDLSFNTITDVSALGSLESLIWLDLSFNTITDISALRPLESLTELDLHNNTIADVSTLGSLESLAWLNLRNNAISDVSVLVSPTSLDLSGNATSNVSALESLTLLDLSGNTISDVSALGSLKSLTTLRLSNNPISDISALGSLQSLDRLDLSDNQIADVTPVVGAGFSLIELRGNPLSADAIERQVPALRATGTAVVAGWPVPIFPSAADPLGRQGFVRVVNRSTIGGDVLVDAVDDAGERFGPLRLVIGAGEAAHFNSLDLEQGNAAKGLSGGVGAPTAGLWHLALSSTLDIEVLSYVRTPDGLLTSVHDTLPREDDDLHAAMFNPGSNSAQRSVLRLVNPSGAEKSVWVSGWDDHGLLGRAFGFVPMPAGGATIMDAAALEALPHGLGDGAGKWRLEVQVPWPVEGASLLTSPGGHLTNLSTTPDADAGGVWRMPLFPAADDASGRQGFVRVINRSWQAGEAQVAAVDDGGTRVGPVTLALKGGRTVHFNSGDLQRGNAEKGLQHGVGPPTYGDWRLELTSDLDIAVTSYIRTMDGFLTSMHDLAPPGVAAQTARVPIFNPGSNRRQMSLLRVMNDCDATAKVRVTGVDDAAMPSGEVRLTVPAGEARTLTAADLEAGGPTFEGALGDGVGKWRLAIASDVPVSVMSLLRSAGGHLTNLSTATRP